MTQKAGLGGTSGLRINALLGSILGRSPLEIIDKEHHLERTVLVSKRIFRDQDLPIATKVRKQEYHGEPFN